MSDGLNGFIFVDNVTEKSRVEALLTADADKVKVEVYSPEKAQMVKDMSATSRTIVLTASPDTAKAFENTVAIVIGYVPEQKGQDRAELTKLVNAGVVDAFFANNPLIKKKLVEGIEAISYLCEFQNKSTKGLEKSYTVMMRQAEMLEAGHSGGMGARV